jgi:hypothetical protein
MIDEVTNVIILLVMHGSLESRFDGGWMVETEEKVLATR